MGEIVDGIKTQENFYKTNEKMKNYKGGDIMSFEIFGREILKSLNIYQVCFILDESKWKLNFKVFREGFKNIEGNYEYVKEVLAKLEQSFEDGFLKEIKEVVLNKEKLDDVCKQSIFFKIDNKEHNSVRDDEDFNKKRGNQCIYMGRCLIGAGREEDPNYNI
jgi:hypothetical protein